MWKIVNRLLNRVGARDRVNVIDNCVVLDDNSTALKFNEHFSSIATRLVSLLPAANNRIPLDQCLHSISLEPTNVCEINSILQVLRLEKEV